MKELTDLTVRARVLKGYGPIVALLVAVLTVALAVPSKVPEVAATDGVFVDGEVPSEVAGTSTIAPAPDGASGPAGPTAGPGLDSAGAAGGAAANGSVGTGTGAAGAARPAAGNASGAPSSCSGGAKQVAAEYSPPCVPWTPGTSNGGSTSRGVTATEITIAVRRNNYVTSLMGLLGQASGDSSLNEPISQTMETLDTLVKYFNSTYHMYGRTLKIAPYDGAGNVKRELFGGGVEDAHADAVKVASSINAFADISAVTLPYADQLSQQKVVNLGPPYPSKDWLRSHAPYSWATEADCTTIAEMAANYYIRRLAGSGAKFAGGDLAGRQRKVFVLAPDNASYSDCADQAYAAIRAAGHGAELLPIEKYSLDFDRARTTAGEKAAKIASSGATTVFCACDPVMMLFLTAQLRQQKVEPEWISTGVAFVDQDLVGQLMAPTEWAHAFGVSLAGTSGPLQQSEAWRAYRQVNPTGRPSVAIEVIYYQLQLLVIGIQGATANLRPESFERALFAFPAAAGRAGRWSFGPNDRATTDDAREIDWSPGARSGQNGRTGAWTETMPGRRFAEGQWPPGDPGVTVP